MSTPNVALARIIPGHVAAAENLLDEAQFNKLVLFVEEVADLTGRVRKEPPTNNTEAHGLTEVLAHGKLCKKELESLRRSRLIPLEAEVAGINDLFRPVIKILDELDAAGKRQLLAFQAAERARAQREEQERQRKLQEAARAEQEALERAHVAETEAARQQALVDAEVASRKQAVVEAAPVAPAMDGFKSDNGSSSSRGRWVLLGVNDYDAIPPVYWQDSKVVEALHKALQRAITAGAREIPGCSIGQEEGITVRTR